MISTSKNNFIVHRGIWLFINLSELNKLILMRIEQGTFPLLPTFRAMN